MLNTLLEITYLEWADQESPALSGQTPRHVAASETGRETVEALIAGMERGPRLRRTGIRLQQAASPCRPRRGGRWISPRKSHGCIVRTQTTRQEKRRIFSGYPAFQESFRCTAPDGIHNIAHSLLYTIAIYKGRGGPVHWTSAQPCRGRRASWWHSSTASCIFANEGRRGGRDLVRLAHIRSYGKG